MTHTPGPWKWTPDDPTMLILHTGEDYIGESSIMWADRCKACAERDAQCGWPTNDDARLIAAAPDMLEALRYYADVAIVEDDGGMRARQAIAQVEGKDPTK